MFDFLSGSQKLMRALKLRYPCFLYLEDAFFLFGVTLCYHGSVSGGTVNPCFLTPRITLV